MKRRILILSANPKNSSRLRLDEEVREIDEGLARARKRDQFELEQKWATRPRDMRRAILDFNPHIVHFSGHGAGEEGLMLENDIGNAQSVTGKALASLFELFSKEIECVLLNACYSEAQATELSKYIPYVIGMSQEIGDKAALEFAVGFYDALGAGRTIEFAFKLGCNAIQMSDIPEYLIPTLYTNKVLEQTSNNFSRTISEQIKKENEQLKRLQISGCSKEEIEIVKNNIKKLERKRGKNPELERGFLLSGRYELLEVIDTGGFATVWKAYDEGENSQGVVAIKVLHEHYAKDISQRSYFFRSARTMSELKHPNIVRIIDPEVEYGKYYYFVMEFIYGRNLEQAVLDKDAPLPDHVFAEKILKDIGSALIYAHTKGHIHRDVKPQNVLIAEDNIAFLADFNLILMKSETARMSTGAVGSFIYTSPEALGYSEVDKSSDVYSLGMTTIFSLYKKYLPPEVFRDSSSFIDRELEYTPSIKSVLIKSVEFESAQRIKSVEDFYAAFDTAWKQRGRQLIKIIPSENTSRGMGSSPYWIGRFTVTNTEYRKFVDADGYSEEGLQRWWSLAGQEVWKIYRERGDHPHIHRMRREDESTQHPLTWNDRTFNRPDQPVVGICWYEAEAYCNWLTEYLQQKNPQKWLAKVVTLPTEEQWEYAARRKDNYTYPWGNSEPNKKLANFNNKNGKPSAVGRHPDGTSWCGCHDMSGNVLEWCRDYFDGKTDTEETVSVDRTIKGGCCYDNNLEEKFSIAIESRRGRKPGYRHSAIGFRVVVESIEHEDI